MSGRRARPGLVSVPMCVFSDWEEQINPRYSCSVAFFHLLMMYTRVNYDLVSSLWLSSVVWS